MFIKIHMLLLRHSVLISSIHAICPIHSAFPELISLLFCKEYELWNYSLCNLLHPPITASLFSQYTLLILCSQTPSIRVLPLTWNTRFHPIIKAIHSYSSVCVWFFNLYAYTQMGRQNILNWIVASNSQIASILKFWLWHFFHSRCKQKQIGIFVTVHCSGTILNYLLQ
jgi:hypothetical protein